MGAASVGHGEFGFGGVSAGFARLGDDLRGGEGPDAVDIGQGSVDRVHEAGDLGVEVLDLAQQLPYVLDPGFSDLGSGGRAFGDLPADPVESLGRGQAFGAQLFVVSGPELDQIRVEAVDLSGAGFDQLPAVEHQSPQVVGCFIAARRREVVLAGGDAGDGQRVEAVGFLAGALLPSGLGGHLRGNLDRVDALGGEPQRQGPSVASGSFDPDPAHIAALEPGDGFAVPLGCVVEGLVLDGPSRLVDHAGRQGVFVGIYPGYGRRVLGGGGHGVSFLFWLRW